MSETTRPTKKQHELLAFLRGFIAEHGYSPSYREIMAGCNYTSVATVALHINNLIKRGHVVKRDKSARSLEVVSGIKDASQAVSNHKHELIAEIESRFSRLEQEASQEILDEVYVLVGALKILGHHEIAMAYAGRLNQLDTNE
jgi:repressor LexA